MSIGGNNNHGLITNANKNATKIIKVKTHFRYMYVSFVNSLIYDPCQKRTVKYLNFWKHAVTTFLSIRSFFKMYQHEYNLRKIGIQQNNNE